MAAGKMHADEVDTDTGLVQRLLAAQFPQWADFAFSQGNTGRGISMVVVGLSLG